MLARTPLKTFILLKNSFKSLSGNDPLRMAAATSFFAFFALPSISIILSKVLSTVFQNQESVISAQLFNQLAQVFGSRSAHQLENISENLQEIPHSPLLTLFGAIFLVLSATTFFAIIKGSLNQLFNIKDKKQNTKATFLWDRFISLGIILYSGVLFIFSLLSDILLSTLAIRWGSMSPYSGSILALLNHLISLLVLTLWFAILFKYLPDIRIRWKAIFIGALLTGFCYKIGAFILGRVLIKGQVGVIFGSSGSIVLILLFIFYSSFLFYYGAAFIKAYAGFARLAAEPKSHAIAYQITEVDFSKRS